MYLLRKNAGGDWEVQGEVTAPEEALPLIPKGDTNLWGVGGNPERPTHVFVLQEKPRNRLAELLSITSMMLPSSPLSGMPREFQPRAPEREVAMVGKYRPRSPKPSGNAKGERSPSSKRKTKGRKASKRRNR